MTERRPVGRPPATDKRKLAGVYLTAAERADVDRRAAALGLDRSNYLRQLVLAGLHSTDVHGSIFMDSGLLDQEEADDAAEAMAAYDKLQRPSSGQKGT